MLSGLFQLNSLDQVIFSLRGVWSYLLLPSFIEMPVVNVSSVDPDLMPHCAASDVGLHCLPMSHLWDARLKWVKETDLEYSPHCADSRRVFVSYWQKYGHKVLVNHLED